MAAKKCDKPETGHSKTQVTEVVIDNPMFNRAHVGAAGNDSTIKAMINMRESPSAYWFHKDIIDAAQYRASTEFRRLWERTGGKGAGSFDYTKDKVDGSTMADPINIGQMEASRQLKEIHNLLGPEGYDIVLRICGQGIMISKLQGNWRVRDRQSRLCREMLNTLAVYLGYKRYKPKRYSDTAKTA